jgi:2-polyprenyl-3-methyl-5-hydroxy-6-metoxy-1,4-benzoquinol methylase
MKKSYKEKEVHKTGEAYQYDYTMRLGPWTTYSYLHDPIHLVFVLSRYKFCARMLAGKNEVLEVGCGDAPGTPIVAQFVKHVHAIDIDATIIESDKKRLRDMKTITYETMDILQHVPAQHFDGVYSIDVIEHFTPEENDVFIRQICLRLNKQGMCIIGTPNSASEQFASDQSREYHLHLHDGNTLRTLMEKYFHTVLLFSMNDEVVHTGFIPMAHYLFALGIGVKNT